MKRKMTVEEHEILKESLVLEQKFALITTMREGEVHDQVSWLNKLGLSDYVIGLASSRGATSITLKVRIESAETIQEYIRFTGAPCWGDVPPAEGRDHAFERN
jgi:hypothetical protein